MIYRKPASLFAYRVLNEMPPLPKDVPDPTNAIDSLAKIGHDYVWMEQLCPKLTELSAEGWEIVCAIPASGCFRILLRRLVKAVPAPPRKVKK